MDTEQIIQQLRSQRGRLDSAIAALEGGSSLPAQRVGGRGPRRMSPEARRRIAAAQRRRWAKVKGQASAAAQANTPSPEEKKKSGHMSSAGRARIAAAQKARWAKIRAQKKK